MTSISHCSIRKQESRAKAVQARSPAYTINFQSSHYPCHPSVTALSPEYAAELIASHWGCNIREHSRDAESIRGLLSLLGSRQRRFELDRQRGAWVARHSARTSLSLFPPHIYNICAHVSLVGGEA